MTHCGGVKLTASTFSCVIWLPCDADQPDTGRQLDALLRDVATAIRRVAPDLLNDMQVSEILVT